jgi:hypothetical protein
MKFKFDRRDYYIEAVDALLVISLCYCIAMSLEVHHYYPGPFGLDEPIAGKVLMMIFLGAGFRCVLFLIALVLGRLAWDTTMEVLQKRQKRRLK